MNPAQILQKQLGLDFRKVLATVKLLDEGATIPFIARYRKEQTGSLDEVQLESIKTGYDQLLKLVKRKEFILKSIDSQGGLTRELKAKIEGCWDETALEDFYLPFKKKVRTKAAIAKEKGLEPLAKFIFEQQRGNIFNEAKKYISPKVKDIKDALEGARFIIAEWISENKEAREMVRLAFTKTAVITSKVVKKKKEAASKFKDYFEFSERLTKCPSHRILAIYRGENEGFLRVKLVIDNDQVKYELKRLFLKSYSDASEQIKLALSDAFDRLLYKSLESEFKKQAKERADVDAIDVFANNLKQLLLASPLGQKKILALDPGFRSGCKLVVLDRNGNLDYNTNIYPHPPQNKVQESLDRIKKLCADNDIEAIAVGNGTAGKETVNLLKAFAKANQIELFLVNENGASIYSASKVAREEFPNQDVTVRGAVSIGRRLMDPLAELVKIDPKAIGVGQYQHDVNQTRLKEKLDLVVEHCVNKVGINLNTSSLHLLQHVSGLGETLSKNIVEFRRENGSFKKRKDLLKVPRMGAKAYEQAAGFLRVKASENPLDNTGIHPESYKLVGRMAKSINCPIQDLMANPQKISSINLSTFVDEKIGLPTLEDIVTELKKPGLDPRGKAKTLDFDENLNSISDLKEGMLVNGVVNNITNFGAFVDIGIKESGLVHISQITDRFIKDPAEVLKLNQEVKAKVLEIDLVRGRISLSLKGLN